MERPIYLDYNATTPVDPQVAEAMFPYLSERFGNASSAHIYGLEAHEALQHARKCVASLVHARPNKIVFTGGGSESDNLAVKGAVFAKLDRQPHVISTAIEHSAVLNTLHYLQKRFGVEVTLLPVDGHGMVDPADIERAIRATTVLVTIMYANNEVGTIQPVAEIGNIVAESAALFHVDAAQAVGKLDVSVNEIQADLLTIAAHKLYGPKGIGALYVRSEVEIDPLIHGSSQEHGLRAGTENVASIVGFGEAARLAEEGLPEEQRRLRELRDELHRKLQTAVPGLELNGHPTERLANTLNVSFPHALNQAVLAYAPEVAASTGSACHSGRNDPSGTLLAMGLSEERALGAVRLSLGRFTEASDVASAANLLAEGYRASATLTPVLA